MKTTVFFPPGTPHDDVARYALERGLPLTPGVYLSTCPGMEGHVGYYCEEIRGRVLPEEFPGDFKFSYTYQNLDL